MSQLVVSGLGGQGIVFLSRVLAEACVVEGRNVLTAETHGMSQRGGAVDSHLKMGDYAGTIVRRGCADAVLVLDASRLDAARQFLRDGGACFVSSEEGCDAGRIAREMDYPRGRNLVLLGHAVRARPDLFPGADALRTALKNLSPPAARENNRRAFEAA